ncbi:hypothetical protein IQ07DRAFT_628456 [Pyrenochaeta sp. DS3sAY3a]|nr:hypothetical protein IQ07DRAFT_628456 [Pyrenochaeta sp. DS3sAY3a]
MKLNIGLVLAFAAGALAQSFPALIDESRPGGGIDEKPWEGGSVAPWDAADSQMQARSYNAHARAADHLFKRKCESSAPYGCSKDGFCWKVCGDGGKWCWTGTGSNGEKEFRKCSNWGQCSQAHPCATGCKKHPEDCGCSC